MLSPRFGLFVVAAVVTSACQDHAAPAHGHAEGAAHAPATAASKPGAHEGAHGYGRMHAMPHSFEGAEKWAKHFDDPERDAWQKPVEVVKLMDIAPGTTVADVGAGTGYFLGYLSEAVGPKGKVLGLDLEPDMVEYMTQRAKKEGWKNVEAAEVAADDPGLEPGSTDRVLIVDTWHHIGDRKAYAAKLAAGLSAEGAIYVVDFTKDSPEGPPAAHRLSAEVVIAELESAGLEAEVLEESLPNQYVVRATK